MSTKDCKVSIIIPVYNGSKFLRQCLDSVVQQTLNDIEIILINDASTDDSRLIINEYVSNDGRVLTVELKDNQGVSAARNIGIDNAIGDYVIFVDADDFWEDSQMLEQLYEKAAKEQADLVSFGFCRLSEAGEKTPPNVETPAVINLKQQSDWRIKYNIWAKLISRQFLLDQAVRFEPSLVMGEDALFSIMLYCNACKLVVVDDVYYCYRINPNSANLVQWSGAKLFDSVRWFDMAIRYINENDISKCRPNLLQSIIIERLRMLFDRLGSTALQILTKQQQQEFFGLWVKCLKFLEPDYFDAQFRSDPDRSLYSEILGKVNRKDSEGMAEFFKSEAYLKRISGAVGPVTLSQQQALQLGQNLLQVNQVNIRCDFGGGVVVTLPRDKAHQLAKQLIANRNPNITLNFT